MYIKILIYMIDNQRVKRKINILFFAQPVVCRPCFIIYIGWGGWTKKRQHGRANFGEVVRPAYPPPIIPHLILPEYPSYFLTTISPSISFNLLYLRYN